MAVCLVCGKEFVPKRMSIGKYCSRECFYSANKGSTHKRRLPDVICPTCGKVFHPKSRKPGRNNYYCSRECAGLVAPEKECPICGKMFKATSNRAKYCSKKCTYASIRKYETRKEAKKAARERRRAKNAPILEAKKREQAKLKAERYAERKLARIAEQERKQQARIHPCAICGEMTARPKYCSDTCQKRAYNNKRDANRRAKIRNALVDSDINLMDVFKNDMGFCYICGRACSFDDKEEKDGTIICGDMYPSIDHVVPLSKGGSHSWGNVRLAHRICNSRKSNLSPALISKMA